MDNTENSFSLNRAHLIYALALPFAALVGFLLAEPLGSNMVVILCLVGALAIPLFMRWYHFLLLMSWNATFVLTFLPGQPPLWMLLSAVGAVIVMLNRCVGLGRPPYLGGPVPKTLLLIGAVVLITALFTGGAGLRSFGGANYGGKRYVFLAATIVAYFVIVSRPIAPRHAFAVVAIFLLSGVTSTLSELAAGPMPFLTYVVPAAMVSLESEYVGLGIGRQLGLGLTSGAMFTFLLARFGARGVLDLTRPWRLLLLLGCSGVGLYSGFRSSFIAQVLVFSGLFWLERLHRTRYLGYLLAGLVVATITLVGFSDRLPNSVQRSLSFLPLNINPVVMADAQGSVDWRTQMWRDVWPEAERHFFFGKGYLLSPTDLYMANVAAYSGTGKSSDGAAVAGDYHNGPLSLLIPFGIWGVLAFLAFVVASVQVMYRYCQLGRPEFATLNRLLLAMFMTRVVIFLFLVGGFQPDLTYLIGIVGVAVSLNGDVRSVGIEPAPPELLEPERVT